MTAVVIVNWNRRDDTLECLDSVYRTPGTGYRVIMVDNGSGDGSVDAVAHKYPQALIIRNAGNEGFCAGANQGIREALSGEARYVLMLNNDMVIDPGMIAELTAVLKREPKAGAVNPFVAYYGRPRDIWLDGSAIDWVSGELLGRHNAARVPEGRLIDIDVVSWGAALIRREALGVVGLLDERLFMYYDDTDWSVRCRRKGFRTLIYAKVLAYHKASASSGGAYSALFYYYYTRNKVLFMRKDANPVRRLQFAAHYYTHARRLCDELSREGQDEKVAAVRDGFWSGLQGRWRTERLVMPQEARERFESGDRRYFFGLALSALFSVR